MGKNTEIIFSARDNGVESTISRIKESANRLGRDLINEASANTSNAKEAIKYYEDQIRLIEKRNRVESAAAKLQSRTRRDSRLDNAGGDKEKIGGIQQDFKKESRNIQTGTKEDQLQVELLRELIEEFKSSGRDENRADDRRSNADRVHAERLETRSANAENSKSASSRALMQGNGTGSSSESVSLGSMASGAGDIVSNQSAGGAAGSALGMLGRKVPVLAAAYGVFKGAQAVWGAKEDQQLQLREIAALKGEKIEGLMNVGTTNGYGPTSLNVSREEFRTQVLPQTMRAYGSTEGVLGSRGKAMKGLEIQKSMGVDAGVVHNMEKLTRTMNFSGGVQKLTKNIYGRLNKGGAFGKSGNDMSRTQDILSSFNELQNGSFMRHGDMTSPNMMIDMMGRFEETGGSYKNDQYKTSTIQSLDRGLATAGSAETRAIKMGILRNANPEMDYFDLEAEMEKGLNANGMMEGLMKFVNNTGGNNNSKKILLDTLTEGNMRGSDIKSMVESGNFEGGFGKLGDGKGFDFAKKAYDASSSLATDAANLNEWWVDAKSDIGDMFGDLMESIDGLIKEIKEWI